VGKNVELKARLGSLNSARETAQRLCGQATTTMRQVDTYFRGANGRLKLRVIDEDRAELIWYEREDAADAISSDYRIVEIVDWDGLSESLELAYGLDCRVAKTRELFLFENVRIHLDQVETLGPHLEFEAVLGPSHDEAEGHRLVARLQREFSLTPGQMIDCSYSDLIRDRQP